MEKAVFNEDRDNGCFKTETLAQMIEELWNSEYSLQRFRADMKEQRGMFRAIKGILGWTGNDLSCAGSYINRIRLDGSVANRKRHLVFLGDAEVAGIPWLKIRNHGIRFNGPNGPWIWIIQGMYILDINFMLISQCCVVCLNRTIRGLPNAGEHQMGAYSVTTTHFDSDLAI